jgi:hypothetical protein
MEVSDALWGNPPLAKSGAGGSGLRGLPPYLEDGVPGLGLPLMSAGSYGTLGGGGLDQSEEPLVGVSGRMGDERSGEMLRGLAVGRGMVGAWPRLELGLELWTVDAAGLKYRSAEILDALYEGRRSVLGLLFNVTLALKVCARPMTVCD